MGTFAMVASSTRASERASWTRSSVPSTWSSPAVRPKRAAPRASRRFSTSSVLALMWSMGERSSCESFERNWDSVARRRSHWRMASATRRRRYGISSECIARAKKHMPSSSSAQRRTNKALEFATML
eukprot:Amastigsp_a14924_19.p4 type:complete len:127 gc:universal Amastigsp_a14924_19:1-381(+)